LGGICFTQNYDLADPRTKSRPTIDSSPSVRARLEKIRKTFEFSIFSPQNSVLNQAWLNFLTGAVLLKSHSSGIVIQSAQINPFSRALSHFSSYSRYFSIPSSFSNSIPPVF
jgi:hypothetical protein